MYESHEGLPVYPVLEVGQLGLSAVLPVAQRVVELPRRQSPGSGIQLACPKYLARDGAPRQRGRRALVRTDLRMCWGT